MTPRQIGQLVLVAVLWGGVFLLVKYALVDFSAVEVAFFQAAIGALGLFVIVRIEGGEARSKLNDILRRPGPALLLGALAIAVPFMLIALGELTVPSGLAGVLASTTPIFVALFSPVLGYNTRINRRQGAGLIVGLIGVALVVGAHFVGSLGQLLGALAVLGAAASGGLSSFVVALQYKDKGIPASTTSFFSLSVGALLTLPVALITAPHELPGTRAVLAVIVLGLLCTALAFMLYYSLIDQIGEERASLATYLTPVFALFYGVLLLGESLTVAAVIGLVLIIVGAEITLRGAGNRHSGGDLRTQHRVHPPFH
ncbi:MAG TPA: DMT family transporter [Rubrobacteraceae bacterium]|jgi:drug/metabolite transporter (DMT)-like permease|nr:DMT family transporter [Rubrobacteraceae bacterium]